MERLHPVEQKTESILTVRKKEQNMLKVFNADISSPDHFVVTLELVPGRQSTGQSVDTLTGIAKDAFEDGRISAVSITDNPGGRPSLSPDILGHEIFKYGMDVIVHFTCRDSNRVGMESRALQLARLGMKNILALTGDYTGKGFSGQGAPVFDFDAVILTRMLKNLNQRLLDAGDPDGFFTGCAVSPFKTTEGEIQAQYRKLDLKLQAGSDFIITQLGYDAVQYRNLIEQNEKKGIATPMLASLYLLSPRAAKAMNRCRVPGVIVSDGLCEKIESEWKVPREGLKQAIERTARLGVILKGLGYRGIHIGGIHKSFDTVGRILDRMDEMENQWEEFLPDFPSYRSAPSTRCCQFPSQSDPCGADPKASEPSGPASPSYLSFPFKERARLFLFDHIPYRMLKTAHGLFFEKSAKLAPLYRRMAEMCDRNDKAWMVKRLLEDPFKKTLLSCKSCGDCGIQHLAFQCPESGCPKHTRNGACGGSRDGYCEVNTDRLCVWVRAWRRLKYAGETDKMSQGFVPPRMWELNGTSSWINFHLNRDHQKK